ncbi:MAG: glycosyltransferase [Allosphingosinicella sp.]
MPTPEKDGAFPGRPLRVCHVFASPAGGRWVCEQLEALARLGCDGVAVLPGEGPTADMCRKAGVPVHFFPMEVFGRRALLLFPLRVIRLAWWMRRNRFDVVQSHIMSSTFYARPAAWLADVPVRLEMSTTPFYMEAPAIARLERRTAWMETGLIPSCEISAALFREAGIKERLILETLYYGPPEGNFVPEAAAPAGLRAEFGLPDGTPLVGSIAVFYPRCGDSDFVPQVARGRYIKGTPDLIDAMPFVREEFPDARLILVGCGWGDRAAETEADLRAYVAERGLSDVVFFAGWRNSTPAVLVDLDVSVQASLVENLGGTVESLLMARPTVATRVGGMPDAVVDGETGLLANPGDPQDLARAIRALLRDRDRAARLGRAGRERMLSRFTLSTTAPGLAALYRRQRAEAKGAFRPHVSLIRLLAALALSAPVFGRAAWGVLKARRARRARAMRGDKRAAAAVKRAPPLPGQGR